MFAAPTVEPLIRHPSDSRVFVGLPEPQRVRHPIRLRLYRSGVAPELSSRSRSGISARVSMLQLAKLRHWLRIQS